MIFPQGHASWKKSLFISWWKIVQFIKESAGISDLFLACCELDTVFDEWNRGRTFWEIWWKWDLNCIVKKAKTKKQWRLVPKDLPLFSRYMVLRQKNILKWKRTSSESKNSKRSLVPPCSCAILGKKVSFSKSSFFFSSSWQSFCEMEMRSWLPKYLYLFFLNCKGLSCNIIKCCWGIWVQFRFLSPLLQYTIESL